LTWLIAEDEDDIRTLIAMMCTIWGHATVTFENGQKVWEWLDSVERGDGAFHPELILMDIRMPGKKGNEIAQRMRKLPQFVKTPIILMTAYSLSERERRDMMVADGVDHILFKPLPDFEQLRRTLDHLMQEKRGA
jgi:CheY-like chemotaxis protein